MDQQQSFDEWDRKDAAALNNPFWNNGQSGKLAPTPDVKHLVDTELIGLSHSKKYRLQFHIFKVTVRASETVTFAENPMTTVGILLQMLIVTPRDTASHKRVCLQIESSQPKIPIWISPARRDQLMVGRWMAERRRSLTPMKDSYWLVHSRFRFNIHGPRFEAATERFLRSSVKSWKKCSL